MTLTLTVDGDRWRAHLRAVADAHPRAGAGRQGQRLRLHPRPAGPQGAVAPPGSASTRSPSAPTRSCPRSPPGTPATCWCSRRGGRSPPEVDAALAAPGRAHRQPARRPGRPARRAARRPDRARAGHDQHAPARHDRPASSGRPRPTWRGTAVPGSRASRCTSRSPSGSHLAEVERLLTDLVAAELPTRTVWVSHLTAAELDDAARVVRRPAGPPADRHRPVARRPRRAAGHLDRARRPRAASAATRSATAAAAPRATGTCWSSAAAPLTASASSRRPASPACARARRSSPGAAWTRSGSPARRSGSTASSGCSPSRRTCRPRCCSCPVTPAVPDGRRPGRRAGPLHRDDVRPRRRQLIGLTAGAPGRRCGQSTSRATIATR